MNSNFQGRRRGKSVSFRGQSNDSNFYEYRQRNVNREQTNFENPDHDLEFRIVKLLPDANMTISLANDFRGSNRGRSRGSRGILKSYSFHDDTHLDSRSSDYIDEYNSSSNRGFESHSSQSYRNRGRARGFYNRPQHASKFAEEREDREREYNHNNDFNFRGRSKSASDRNRRGRGGRGRSRGRVSNRMFDDHCEGPTAGDGVHEMSKETSDNLEYDGDKKSNENNSFEPPLVSDSYLTASTEDENKISATNKEQSKASDLPAEPSVVSETETKIEDNKKTEEEKEAKLDESEQK